MLRQPSQIKTEEQSSSPDRHDMATKQWAASPGSSFLDDDRPIVVWMWSAGGSLRGIGPIPPSSPRKVSKACRSAKGNESSMPPTLAARDPGAHGAC
ncbi:hypothetical protein Nepgr_026580 [Nepenthes gracilis]|uniref:Uncharacterized protein n=1 Tax=Nepenthes gracilis TaxID=150966 RepID=A0AAD3TA04_NEPGR|nr:hypothetical protein Nepgr_026580 [Nepenthes gracilis]